MSAAGQILSSFLPHVVGLLERAGVKPIAVTIATLDVDRNAVIEGTSKAGDPAAVSFVEDMHAVLDIATAPRTDETGLAALRVVRAARLLGTEPTREDLEALAMLCRDLPDGVA